jgi:hypothetical protein
MLLPRSNRGRARGASQVPAQRARLRQAVRVPGPPGFFRYWHLAAGVLLNGCNHFAHAVAVSRSQIEGSVLSAAGQMKHRQNVRLRNIVHVDVVANRGSVGSWIVNSKNGHLAPFAARRLHNKRNQMRFRIMRLADLRVHVRARRVEVAQGNPLQSICLAIPAQHFFNEQFRLAVRVHRILRMSLIDRKRLRFAIRGARGGKDNLPNSGFAHGIK